MYVQKRLIYLTHVGDSVIVSHKQETITSFIETHNNSLDNYVLIEEGDISKKIELIPRKIQMGNSNYRKYTQ